MAKTDKKKLEAKLILLREQKIRGARNSLWKFCKIVSPKFYKDDKPHLKEMCGILQKFYERTLLKTNGEAYDKVMINLPPRFGKSQTLVNFVCWVYGKKNSERVITSCYVKDLAIAFSRFTRDTISRDKNTPVEIVYNDIFPETTINKSNSAVEHWALTNQFSSYKACSTGSSITGSGASITICDDLVADADAAVNVTELDKIWSWYINTFLSRKEKNCLEIMVGTRWSKLDPCGRILEGINKDDWYVINMEAYDQDTDKYLCPAIMDEKEYLGIKSTMSDSIFRANYHQETIDEKGRLYKYLSEYKSLPDKIEHIYARVDTADCGKDYTAMLVYAQSKGKAYVIDVYYSQEAMEITEPAVAKMLVKNRVQEVVIESNNGGRGFSRNISKIMYDELRYHNITVVATHQSKNKISRILANATNVMNSILFPEGYKQRWRDFWNELMSYSREGKNRHDDACDVVTSVAEALQLLNRPIFLGRKR